MSKVTLICIATAADGSPATYNVTYAWIHVDCYSGSDSPCFYGHNPTTQNITSDGLLARDAGSVICSATIDGNLPSSAITLRISGELYT